jgi:outer membrane protein OmpA-like peptidoglycan-associated protein
MSSGILSGLSGVRRVGLQALGLAVLSAGLVLGGCNNKLKEEHEAAMKENAELRERLASTDTEKNSMQQQVSALQSDKSRLESELNQARTQPMPQGGGNWDNGPVAGGGRGGRGDAMPRTPRGGGGRSERTIEISSDVLFGPGSATLKSDAKSQLNKYVSQLKNASTVRIEGHTDSDPIKKSKWPSNKALSQARADAVRDYLVTRGVPKSKIETVGKGSTEPKGSKKDSRRVDIVVVE